MSKNKKVYKYTAAGKKVLVSGQLNNQFVCQEVFIIKEQEVLAKSNTLEIDLFDEPPISWRDNHAKQKELENDILIKELDQTNYRIREEVKIAKDYLSSILKVKDKTTKDKLQRAIDFISGTITHFVKWHYGTTEILTYKDLVSRWDGRYDGFKLLSMYGKFNGDIEYRINNYGDGSGHDTTIYPCKSEEEAIQLSKKLLIDYAKEKIEKDYISDDVIKICNKYKIKIDKEKLLKHYQLQIASITKNHEDYQNKANQYAKDIRLIQRKIKLTT